MEKDIIVISDLHLSEGTDKDTGKISRNEDFFFDNEFSKFIDYLISQKDKSYNLIINGDFFDFLQVIVIDKHKPRRKNKHYELKINNKEFKLRKSENDYGLGTSEEKSVLKMKVIAEGHRTLFKALNKFLIKGNTLSIIKGNHDVELHWENVKEEFKNQIVKACLNKEDEDIEDIKKRINFYPWIYYDLGIYIEHGNQYESINSFEYFLQPTLPKPNDNEIYLPVGSFFVRYFFNKIETITPFADNIKPVTSYISWVFRNKFFYLWRIIGEYANLFTRVFKKTKYFTEEQMRGIKEIHEKKFKKLSQKFSLEISLIKTIDNMKKTPILKSRFKLLNIMCRDLFLSFIFLILTVLLFYTSWVYLENIRPFIMFVILILIYFIPSIINSVISPLSKRGNYLRNIAKSIHKCLGEKVKYIIFGHTHNPDIFKITEDCYYYNTGTWTPLFTEEERIIREIKQFTFLHIQKLGKPILFAWNNDTGEPEPLKLFRE